MAIESHCTNFSTNHNTIQSRTIFPLIDIFVEGNPRDHLHASYNLGSGLKSEYAGRNHSDLNKLPKIAKISLKNAKIRESIGNC